MRLIHALFVCLYFVATANPAANASWSVARNPDFEVFSQAGSRDAESAIIWLERLRAFFIQAGISTGDGDRTARGPVRVIRFRSERDFAPFRPSDSADAFFLPSSNRDYLVLSSVAPAENSVVAHEYTHLVLHSLELPFPEWLSEGLAEFFSTVSISGRECTVGRECTIGSDLPLRRAVLQRGGWIPLPALLSLDSVTRLRRQDAAAFYAEAWALTDMLILSPKYNDRLPQLIGQLAGDPHSAGVITRVYRMPLSGIEADLRAWIQRPQDPKPLPPLDIRVQAIRAVPLDEYSYGFMLADLNFACGNLRDAEAQFRSLENKQPKDPMVHAALGSVALRRGRTDTARLEWKRALELGVRDANLCYQYALLAENAGVPAAELEAALTKAVRLAPDFDDARYKLALLELDRNNYAEVVRQLRAMRTISTSRAYGYWTAMSEALLELNQRDEAKIAADNARKYAMNEEQRASASLAHYMASTDLTVQLSRTADGKEQMVTARKPHDGDGWNPFIEVGDQIQRFEGKIRKVECTADKITGFEVASDAQSVKVLLPDPSRVMITGGDPEFVCGAEDGRKVAIVFATATAHGANGKLLRGMRFE